MQDIERPERDNSLRAPPLSTERKMSIYTTQNGKRDEYENARECQARLGRGRRKEGDKSENIATMTISLQSKWVINAF
jgi:hypothetical protein